MILTSALKNMSAKLCVSYYKLDTVNVSIDSICACRIYSNMVLKNIIDAVQSSWDQCGFQLVYSSYRIIFDCTAILNAKTASIYTVDIGYDCHL